MSSNNRLTFEGLDDLKAALRALPSELAGDASGIVMGAANGAESDVESAYPERTGNLKKGLKVETVSAGPYGAGARLINRSPHAYIFENGTQARHTDIGANRGSMPPGNVFIPAVIRRRRSMYERLKGLLESKGLQVSGDAG